MKKEIKKEIKAERFHRSELIMRNVFTYFNIRKDFHTKYNLILISCIPNDRISRRRYVEHWNCSWSLYILTCFFFTDTIYIHRMFRRNGLKSLATLSRSKITGDCHPNFFLYKEARHPRPPTMMDEKKVDIDIY